jgi:hypothetical protein
MSSPHVSAILFVSALGLMDDCRQVQVLAAKRLTPSHRRLEFLEGLSWRVSSVEVRFVYAFMLLSNLSPFN